MEQKKYDIASCNDVRVEAGGWRCHQDVGNETVKQERELRQN